jgi:hypothetical protein
MFYFNLDFQPSPGKTLNEIILSANKEFDIDFLNPKTQKRLLRMKREKN